jgi:hypothetical protein
MVAQELLYSMKASAHGNDVEPSVSLLTLLFRRPYNSPPPVADLLPDAWLATHPGGRWRLSRQLTGSDPRDSKLNPLRVSGTDQPTSSRHFDFRHEL